MACGTRPVAWTQPRVDFCDACLPGGPFTPPPSQRCGSRDCYYSAGLCAACHRGAPKPAASCPECYAFGVKGGGQRHCEPRSGWHKGKTTGTCARCGREVTVDRQRTYRLCRRQELLLPPRQRGALTPITAHQLFFDFPLRAHTGGRPHRRASSEAPAPRRTTVRNRNRWLALFEPYNRPRRYSRDSAQVRSCADCLAWGVTQADSWLCYGCQSWRRNHRQAGACATCGRVVTLGPRGSCRLCWRQASMLRGRHGTLDLVTANRHGQQLFFANMFQRLGRRAARAAPPAMAPAVIRPVTWRQLVLFHLPRDLTAVTSLSVFPDPPDPQLAAFLDQVVTDRAARLGWPKGMTVRARAGIRVLLTLQDTPGAPIKASDTAVLTQLRLACGPVREVLAEAGLLGDDRVPAIHAWFTRTTAGLPEPMASELRTWFEVMTNGSTTPPRSRPRHPRTVEQKLRWALPALRAWAGAGHTSLREITREQVLAALPASGTARATTGQGLRSVFTVLKAHKVTFTNPAARISTGRAEVRQPLPASLAPPADRAAGYRYDISVLQAEFSLTQVLDKPASGRIFFDQVIADNLDIGRPEAGMVDRSAAYSTGTFAAVDDDAGEGEQHHEQDREH